jgi:periplasmic divalent cation tolerance protein
MENKSALKILGPRIVMVTVPDLKTGRKLAKLILSQKQAACVNIVPGLESHYWWKKRVELSRECLLLIKTRQKNLKALHTLVKKNHPYDVPEFITLQIKEGSRDYLRWLGESVS